MTATKVAAISRFRMFDLRFSFAISVGGTVKKAHTDLQARREFAKPGSVGHYECLLGEYDEERIAGFHQVVN